MQHMTLSIDAEGIALVTLDHATETMNLVSQEWIQEFSELVAQLAADPCVMGVILTSGKAAFMAGADLKMFTRRYSVAQALETSRLPTQMHRQLETCGKPWVAAINGLALGGGFELALACHRRILADQPKAVVGLPEVNVGLLPGSGGTQRLARMIGMKGALDVLLSGRSYRPAEALKIGLVDELAPADRLMDAARAWLLSSPDAQRAWDKKGYAHPEGAGLLNPKVASFLSVLPAQNTARTQQNYPAPAAITAVVFEGMQMPFDAALKLESKYFAKLLADPVAGNIIRTTFVNKGDAAKLARRPAGVPKASFETVAVLGAGMMGAGIAHVAAQAGMQVHLLDRTFAEAESAKTRIARTLAREVEKGRRAATDADAILARIHPTDDVTALAPADIVVEAVFEDTDIKAEITARVEAVLRKGVIFASNTSTLPISRLAQAARDPARFIGLHFFSPVERMELVEVIMGKATSQQTLAEALDFVARLRKVPIVVNDSRGFYTSRVFQTFIHEGLAMLSEGVAPALIENAAKQAGMPVGPLALLDEVTLDLPLKIIAQAEAEEGTAYTRPCGFDAAQRMVAAGRSSRKAGGAFYEYPESAPKHLWPGLTTLFPQTAQQPDVEALKQRFLYIQALETARCLDEGVLTHPVDGDIGSVLGWGFPTWTGGTLSLIDTVGLAEFIARCELLAQAHGPRFSPGEGLRARLARGATITGV
jgi:3-hydroxyacyl-CoA dehydrogenase / enoyl-CoA hydratase / 3-hydroxybutyryl-CoA epimerase